MKILADVFPSHVSAIPADVLDDIHDLPAYPPLAEASYLGTTRVIITEEAIIIAQDSPEGAKIVFQEPYIDYIPGETYRVITKSGKMVAFKKDTNCGCGSRLRGWNPYKTLNSIKDPR
jgi:hypothetical protein